MNQAALSPKQDRDVRSSIDWVPQDYIVLIVAVSVSLALLLVVGGTLYLLSTGAVKPEQLGRVSGLGKGTGLLGILSLVVFLAAKIVNPDQRLPKKDKKQVSRRALLAPVLGIVITVATGFSSSIAASSLQRQIAATQAAEKQKQKLQSEINLLQTSRQEILDFMANVSRRDQIQLIDNRVDWPRITTGISSLQPGKRKTAVYSSLLLAWKDIPLNLHGEKLRSGVDSPSFFKRVFENLEIPVPVPIKGELLSHAMMRQFRKVDQPEPGDLIFYRGEEPGSVGNFVMMYLGPGLPGGHGACIGAFDAKKPLQVIDSIYFDQPDPTAPADHFLGYYRPPYAD